MGIDLLVIMKHYLRDHGQEFIQLNRLGQAIQVAALDFFLRDVGRAQNKRRGRF